MSYVPTRILQINVAYDIYTIYNIISNSLTFVRILLEFDVFSICFVYYRIYVLVINYIFL